LLSYADCVRLQFVSSESLKLGYTLNSEHTLTIRVAIKFQTFYKVLFFLDHLPRKDSISKTKIGYAILVLGPPLKRRRFKGTVSRDFLLQVLFMNQLPPSPNVFHYDRLTFFRKFAEIFAAQGGGKWKKIFNQKNFNNFFWSPLGSRGNIYINFFLQVHFQVSAA
jgi:hypothetical protein